MNSDKPKKISSLISQDYLTVSNEGTVGSTLDWLRSHRQDVLNKFAYLYVINKQNELIGVLRVRDLLIEEPSKSITQITQSSIISVSEDISFDELVRLFETHSFFAIPVIDHHRHLTGIIPAKQIEPYLKRTKQEPGGGGSIFEIALKRLPWLVISVSSGLVCAYILGIFIGKIESVIALILFVPIILGLAGSVGTQSASVTISGLNENQLAVSKLMKTLGREIAVGITIGSVSFLIAFLIALLWRKAPVEGIALGLSIIAVTISSGILGIILPIVLRIFRIKIDSNFASGLFLLLICDIVALLVYFTISLSFVSPRLEII